MNLASLVEGNALDCTLTSTGTITPFLQPYEDVRPGQHNDNCYRLHELYPRTFTEATGFMGAQPNQLPAYDDLWEMAEEQEVREGYVEAGIFHAPYALYALNHPLLPKQYLLIFQRRQPELSRSSQSLSRNGT